MENLKFIDQEALKNKILEYEAILEPQTMRIIIDLINRADALNVRTSIIEESLCSNQQIRAVIHINRSDLLDFYAQQMLDKDSHIKTGSDIFVEKSSY